MVIMSMKFEGKEDLYEKRLCKLPRARLYCDESGRNITSAVMLPRMFAAAE